MKNIDDTFGYGNQGGFTLLELMIVVIIIGVMAAVAFPAYRQHLIHNTEMEAQSQLGNLQIELERWRATAMSYRGFFPLKAAQINGTTTTSSYGYNNKQNTTILVPLGSDTRNFRYQIELLDGTQFDSLSPAPSQNITLGRSWVMLATPNPRHNIASGGRTFLMRSDGLKCVTKSTTVPRNFIRHTGDDCPTGTEKW